VSAQFSTALCASIVTLKKFLSGKSLCCLI